MSGLDLTDVQARHVWRGTLIAALLNACFSPLDPLLSRGVVPVPWWPSLLASAFGLVSAAFILLVHRRRPQPIGLGSALFVLNNAAVLAALTISGSFHIHNPHLFPFQGHKLGVLTVAILAPERWAGLTCIAAYALAPVIQLALFEPAQQERVGAGEPIVLLVFGACAAVLLLFRLRGLAIERELVQARTEAADARRTARLLLAVRDLSNGPLQVIALASAAVRARAPELRDPLDRIDRALDRLRALHRPLKVYEADLDWRPGDESFDPEAVLAAAEARARLRQSTPM